MAGDFSGPPSAAQAHSPALQECGEGHGAEAGDLHCAASSGHAPRLAAGMPSHVYGFRNLGHKPHGPLQRACAVLSSGDGRDEDLCGPEGEELLEPFGHA